MPELKVRLSETRSTVLRDVSGTGDGRYQSPAAGDQDRAALLLFEPGDLADDIMFNSPRTTLT